MGNSGAEMKMGTQVVYIPNHANGNIQHKDVEFGFVTGRSPVLGKLLGREEGCYCRYWSKELPNKPRTLSCSELTPARNLIEHSILPQSVIYSWMEKLGYRRESR